MTINSEISPKKASEILHNQVVAKIEGRTDFVLRAKEQRDWNGSIYEQADGCFLKFAWCKPVRLSAYDAKEIIDQIDSNGVISVDDIDAFHAKYNVKFGLK